ncbi:sodium-translocating pyrophosphatase [Candidatus Woesearchaeota archaeon]|nr:sodium-translocating pyrophosphatase [Candidatus Woesearchaeota archaeon]
MGVLVISALGLWAALAKAKNIAAKPAGNDAMKEIAEHIHHGALTFLHREYGILAAFVAVVGALLFFYIGKGIAVSFLFGGILSAAAGNIGMRTATKANVRAAEGAKKSIGEGLSIAFSSGSVMGLSVVCLGLIGVTVFYLIFKDPQIVYGFGLGASSIALFARVGGGIYTKAADVGADLVGKVEAGIPEDSPRNPAVIADNVGDNVGDIAGMGADLYESYVQSIISAMVIGAALTLVTRLEKGLVLLPLLLAAFGIICSLAGMLFVRASKKGNPQSALNRGVWISSFLMAAGSFFLIGYVVPNAAGLGIFYAMISGLFAGLVIGEATEYYTTNSKKPTQAVAEASLTGGGTNIIQGLALGMNSTIIPVLAICAAIFVSYYYSGMYGIAIAAVGMLSTLGITLAIDCYGPVADNAAGIAEMAGLGGAVRKRCEDLDAVGNTTAAIGKGFAIGSAALTALALFASFTQLASQLTGAKVLIDITSPNVIIGLFIGGLLPFVFSSLALKAVGKAAFSVVKEVRRQFKTIKGLLAGKAKPDSKRCVAIVTVAALKEMIVPGLLALVIPLAVGFSLGIQWDNAKKYIEGGKFGGKGSDAHKVSVIGDTVGDPFKDTAGPSLNILIKLMSIVALVALPLMV